MPIQPRRPRLGRIVDVVVVAVLFFVFAGLAVYHYRRLDRAQVDPAKLNELAKRTLDEKSAAGADWPQWRGPNRDGVCAEAGVLIAWPEVGSKQLWEAKVGEGFASVVVAKGRVFTIFQDGDHEAIAAWNAETGQEIWRFRYPCRYKNNYGNGPRSTPSIDGDLIYAVGATGHMHCLKAFTDDPMGERVWSKNLMEEFGAAVPKWGVAFSPLVDESRVFVMPGGPNGNALAALDKLTGAILWKSQNDLASYSSPIAATIRDTRQILFLTGGRLVSVRPDTGAQLWEFPWPIENQCNIATPIVVGDYIFISSYYGRGCALFEIAKTGGVWEANPVYKNKRMRNHLATCVRHKDYLYGFDDSTLKCMNFRTGEVTWKEEERSFGKGSVVMVNDQLIVYGANGLLALVQATPTEYTETSRFQFSAQTNSCWSAPVVANGRLYVRDQEKLVCFDVKAEK
jgi:outer membrane protein assembly factor BamB